MGKVLITFATTESRMKSQLDLLLDRDWDTIIMLDACREDIFKSVSKKFFRGEHNRCTSLGSATPEYIQNLADSVTNELNDVIYISGNPHINSRSETHPDLSDTFYKVVDVWDGGTDPEHGVVTPDRMSSKLRELHNEYPTQRIIAHYMQPHTPFLSRDIDVKPENLLIRRPGAKNISGKVFNVLDKKIKQHVGRGALWKLKTVINYPPANEFETLLRMEGRDGLLKAYRENLQIALEDITRAISDIDGQVVLTADHGEFLGESGNYWHQSGSHHDAVRTVPWFEVESVVLDPVSGTFERQAVDEKGQDIEQRLADLGYF